MMEYEKIHSELTVPNQSALNVQLYPHKQQTYHFKYF